MTIRITVGGTNLTTKVPFESVSITETVTAGGPVSTASFEVIDNGATVSIDAKDAVVIDDDGGSVVYFKGEVAGAPERQEVAPNKLIWKVDAQDYNQLLAETVVTTYSAEAGTADDDEIVDDLVSTFRGEGDIDSTTDVAQIVAAASMPDYAVAACSLSEALADLCKLTGGRFYVDFDKNLHYYASSPDANADALTDGGGNYRYWGMRRLGDIGVINAVYVEGKEISGWRTDATSVSNYGSREVAIHDQNITDEAALNAAGDAILNANKDPAETYELYTLHDGYRAGENVAVTSSVYGLSAESMLIIQVETSFLTGDKPVYKLTVGDDLFNAPMSAQATISRIAKTELRINELDTLAAHGWSHDLVFSATDNDTVAWAAGNLYLAGGVGTFAIDAGNTGNMAALTYIYFDSDTATDALQTDTDASNTVGANKILLGAAENVAAGKNARFHIFGGDGEGVLITADNITADTITANEIAANTITAAEIAADTITASEIAAATITGTEIAANAITADKLIIGDSPFTPDNGLLLLGQPIKLERAVGGTTNYWRSTRGQRAQVGAANATPGSRGSIQPVQGKWKESLALRCSPAATNLISNTSIETATTGWVSAWNDTVTQSDEQAKFGSYSLKVVYGGPSAGFGVMYTEITGLTPANVVTFSAWIYYPKSGEADGNDPQLIVWDGGGFTNGEGGDGFTANDRWTRYTVQKTVPAGGSVRLGIFGNGNSTGTFYADGLQLEDLEVATAYLDGSLGDGFSWSGIAHASTSSRIAGNLVLDDYAVLLEANATVSFSVWLQVPYDYDADWPTTNHQVFDVAKTGDDNNRYYLSYYPPSDVWIIYINGATRASVAANFSAGDIIHLVATLDFTSDEYKLYVNGVLGDTDTTSLSAPSGLTDWVVGASYAQVQQAGYVISEFAVFDDILTEVEVNDLYELKQPLVDLGSSEVPGILLTDMSGNRIEITAYEIGVYQDNDKCVEIDNDGIAILVSDAYSDIRSYQFVDSSGAVVSQIKALKNAGGNNHYVSMKANDVTGYDSYAVVEAESPSGEIAEAELLATQGSDSAVVIAYISTGGSEEIWHVIHGTVHTVTDNTGFRVYTKIYGNNDLVFETGGSGTYSIRPDFASGSGYLGDATYYWNVINYKTLTDRGCLADFGPVLTMRDGSEKTPLQALGAIRTGIKASAHGNAPMLDYKSFPDVCYVPGLDQIATEDIYDNKGKLVWRKGEPCGDEGIEISSLLSVMLAAMKELEAENQTLKSRVGLLESK
jgi:hypothetical protein